MDEESYTEFHILSLSPYFGMRHQNGSRNIRHNKAGRTKDERHEEKSVQSPALTLTIEVAKGQRAEPTELLTSRNGT